MRKFAAFPSLFALVLLSACVAAPAGEAGSSSATAPDASNSSASSAPVGETISLKPSKELALSAEHVLTAEPRQEALVAPTAPDAPLSETDKLLKRASFADAMASVADRQRVFQDDSDAVSLDGQFAQGGLIFGQTAPGAEVRLDGKKVLVGEDGKFVFGFGRDAAPTVLLTVALPDGPTTRRSLEIADREFKVQRIDGLDQSKVSGFTEKQLEKIGQDRKKKDTARANSAPQAFWAVGFDWPVTGRISGVFGSQRILNGEPKRPHSGVDVARPTGTPVRAPADGVITLAETGMYFEGGLVFLDHGHWVESAFLHLSRVDVEPGQAVKKGDIIGAIGATGRATGPHLHWSVRWSDRLVDPQLLVGDMPASDSAGQ